MDIEYIKKMFVGEILVVDDQVNDEDTDVYGIIEYLKEQKFSVLSKDTFPDDNDLSGHKLSMVICDWMFFGENSENNAKSVIGFLNKIQSKEFVPVFICTSLEKAEVEKYLLNTKYECEKYKGNDASCIFIVKKDEIKREKIFEFLRAWLLGNPSVKLLKEWEIALETAKYNMFNDLYMASEYWPCVLAKAYEEDGEKNIGESMGEFVTKNLISRISDYDIGKIMPRENVDINIEAVLDGERCYYYRNNHITNDTSFRTGDIIKKAEEFYIVIKRQCDLIRDNRNLYVLKMKELSNISQKPISISIDDNSIKILDNTYQLNSATENKINKQLMNVFSKTRVLHQGKILETSFQVIIPCVCHKKVVVIDLRELDIIKFEMDDFNQYERIARLLEPYISIVTEKFAAYTSSKGSMRTPEELFSEKYFVDN